MNRDFPFKQKLFSCRRFDIPVITNYNIDKISVAYDDKDFSHQEIEVYVEIAKSKIENLSSIKLRLEGDKVAVDYTAQGVPFERIRRITGYLVGTLDRWNNSKRAEESERVKHATE